MATTIYTVHTQSETADAQQLALFLHPHIKRGRIILNGAYKNGAGGASPELIREGIQGADVIVLLVSARLLVECEETIQLAMVRSKLRLAPVIPVLLSHALLRQGILDEMITLPRDPTRPHVADFSSQAEAWHNVVTGILSVVDDLPRRRVLLRQEQEQQADGSKVQMLFLASNPSDTGKLLLSLEFGRVQGRIESLGLTTRFKITDEWNVDPGDLAAALLRYRPQVVHFSGHGRADGSILLQGLQTEPTPMTGKGLRQIFLSLPQQPQLLVLNSCFTGCAAETLVDAAHAVIGYLDPVTDKDAIVFADILYMNLARGRSVQESFDQARGVVHEPTRVVLTSRAGVDPAQLRLSVPQAL